MKKEIVRALYITFVCAGLLILISPNASENQRSFGVAVIIFACSYQFGKFLRRFQLPLDQKTIWWKFTPEKNRDRALESIYILIVTIALFLCITHTEPKTDSHINWLAAFFFTSVSGFSISFSLPKMIILGERSYRRSFTIESVEAMHDKTDK